MKKTLLALLLPAVLAGCQMTKGAQEEEAVPVSLATDTQEDTGVAAAGTDTLPAEPESSDVDVLADGDQESQAQVAPFDDLWDQISNDFSLSYNAQEPRILTEKRWFEKHPKYLERVSQRAEPFLYLITKELKDAGVPAELALLPIVESAFDPFAYSRGRAAGMWQFISGTGDRFGLEQDYWYDGRRDVLASTKAAAAYLKYLNQMFDGDWLNALAAYNSGEGRVLKAIAHNKKKGKATDFWALDLPRETRSYVPRLLALVEILKSEEGRSHFKAVANEQRLAEVKVKKQLDLSVAADLAGISVKKLHALNPGFNRWATSPDATQTLLLPVAKADQFETQLAALPAKDRLRWARHKVRSGDSLLKIAHEYETDVASLRKANNIKGNMIRVGQEMMIPLSSQALADGRPSQAVANRRATITHKVQSGESLWTIAHKYNVSTADLAKWNGMKKTDTLSLNRKLTVWLTSAQPSGVSRNVSYKVRRGDSLSLIASKFKVSVADLRKWNQLDDNGYLQPGQVLKLLVDVTRS
ncbi:LysM peptidoglycan-binding domain-containing protein [Gallaecimonas kandeliae]|uniref:lytic transglycosylase n=1 Tax=Gallaecimonas kandeliae TaxID=3029055 RepID=UPI00264850E6|nr:LysM peptidoglycan-binding domain-containing protein [Gallaecimonas kandeliae]WKE64235.1 LysM peptidoglycan-binding domain-containing protein [Gallaecimonas kandeliae]